MIITRPVRPVQSRRVDLRVRIERDKMSKMPPREEEKLLLWLRNENRHTATQSRLGFGRPDRDRLEDGTRQGRLEVADVVGDRSVHTAHHERGHPS
jgi:hypothetical protein